MQLKNNHGNWHHQKINRFTALQVTQLNMGLASKKIKVSQSHTHERFEGPPKVTISHKNFSSKGFNSSVMCYWNNKCFT